jgi:hypothetical protein
MKIAILESFTSATTWERMKRFVTACHSPSEVPWVTLSIAMEGGEALAISPLIEEPAHSRAFADSYGCAYRKEG